MLYAGIMITPAISILSAVEGLEIASPAMSDYVIPLTLAILVGLFAVQRFGTATIGIAFGPIMVLWFVALTALGIGGIVREPSVLEAVDPRYAIAFFQKGGIVAFLILFAVFLVTTGAESLYADIGHFGRAPIRRLWFFFVLPALLINYFGQGAALLADPKALTQPFFYLVPKAVLYPMVGLATLATIIASQAAITGAFSMTNQAARLSMMPPSQVVQTSEETSGQVYVPFMNWLLMVAAIVLVLLFRSANALASTYGISVSTTMVVTTILAFLVARERGRRSTIGAFAFLLCFLAIDLTYFGSNLLRIPHGGWFPVVVATCFFTVMSTWRRGVDLLTRKADEGAGEIGAVIDRLSSDGVARVPGCAVFLTQRPSGVPIAMMRHIERSHALQRVAVLLSVVIDDIPRTAATERFEKKVLAPHVFRVVLHYGYMEDVRVPSDLAASLEPDVCLKTCDITYYIGHASPVSGRGRLDGMVAWRDRLLGFLMRNSADRTADYGIPHDEVIEMGLKVPI